MNVVTAGKVIRRIVVMIKIVLNVFFSYIYYQYKTYNTLVIFARIRNNKDMNHLFYKQQYATHDQNGSLSVFGALGREFYDTFLKSRRHRFFFLIAIFLIPVFAIVYVYASSPIPTIMLAFPKENQEVVGEKIFVKGSVIPHGSRVVVNKEEVAGNGDGSFTAVVTIPEGKNTLAIEASYRGKKAKALYLIVRALSEEEKQAKLEKQKKEELAVAQKVLGEDQKVDELLSAYNTGGGISGVHVLTHELKKAGSFRWVAGEVINGTLEDAYWVKAEATFYDVNNNVVDTQIGFAAAEDKVLKPGEVAKFKTKSTVKDFSYYKLNVDWKTNEVVGGNKVSTDGKKSP